MITYLLPQPVVAGDLNHFEAIKFFSLKILFGSKLVWETLINIFWLFQWLVCQSPLEKQQPRFCWTSAPSIMFCTAHFCSKIEGVSSRQPDLGKSLGKVLGWQHLGLLQAIQRGETAETLQGQSFDWKISDQWWKCSEHVCHLHCKTVHGVQLLPGHHHQGRFASHVSQGQQGRAGTAEYFSVLLNISVHFSPIAFSTAIFAPDKCRQGKEGAGRLRLEGRGGKAVRR